MSEETNTQSVENQPKAYVERPVVEKPVSTEVATESQNEPIQNDVGELVQEYSGISLELNNDLLLLKRNSESKDHKSKHGLYRALIANMVEGVSKGFTKELELVGVGYRANCQGQKLDLSLGFSHNIIFEIASEVKVETISEKGKNPIVKLTSIDKQLLGYVAAKIRSFRKPEPYKGKGIKFIGEQIRRKAGKSA